MILSILIPALERRPWQRVVSELQKQAAAVGDVEVLVEVDNGTLTSGQKRNRLMSRASGRYVCHVDDDDDVDPDYVRLIVEGCRRGVDVVTFKLAMNAYGPEVWTFGVWESSRRKRGRMMVSHLKVHGVPTSLAKSRSAINSGYADDQPMVPTVVPCGTAEDRTPHRSGALPLSVRPQPDRQSTARPAAAMYPIRETGLALFPARREKSTLEVSQPPKNSDGSSCERP